LGSAYFQQSRIVEDGDESIPFTIDPHRQTIRDLQIFIAGCQQEGYRVMLCMDGNQDDQHVFMEQNYNGKCCTPLGFHYDNNIDGSIATMIDTCDLVNVHKLHVNISPTQSSSRSSQIDFIFISASSFDAES
jgi:hypothetical protein